MVDLAGVWNRWKIWWLSALAGALLGCMFRLMAAFASRMFNEIFAMTIAFMVVVPFVMGYVSVQTYLTSRPEQETAAWKWLLLPLASVLLSMAVALLVRWEGYICLIVAAPIMLFSSLVGGITGRVVWDRNKNRAPRRTLLVTVLPLIVLMVESQLPAPWETRTVRTQIEIQAPADVVWDNIKSVRPIEPGELHDAWVTRIGFPRPVAAILSREGTGGVRQASFTGGLVFTETVNRWEPGNVLRFSIRANTDTLPPTTLDEHVTIGGPFFDVLEGEYTIEQAPRGVALHLASRERLSTHFNLYAGFWTDAIMKSIQQQILEVIRNRCEYQGRLSTGSR